MSKLVVSEFVTLDGVMEEPRWTVPYWGDDIAAFKFSELFESGALLLGRITYEGFAQAWPGQTDEQGYADRMNGLPKYVPTTTLTEGTWNNSNLIKENALEEIASLKQQDGQNILVFGSATLVDSLLKAGLVDELRLLVYPLVLGKGKRTFQEGFSKNLELVDTKTFKTGAILLTYRPAKAEKESEK